MSEGLRVRQRHMRETDKERERKIERCEDVVNPKLGWRRTVQCGFDVGTEVPELTLL